MYTVFRNHVTIMSHFLDFYLNAVNMYLWYSFAYILIKSCRQYHSWAVRNEQTLVKQPTRALAAVSD